MNKKVYDTVVNGRADNSIDFSDFQNLIVDLGFKYRRHEGSHIMYHHSDIKENMNVQSK